MPLSQRFFGGDAPQNFIAGDQWTIQSGPLIRSIPENRLNAADTLGGPIGGTSFWSFNSTFSVPLWGRPIVPKEVAENPDIPKKIQFAENTAKHALTLTYQKDLPEFKTLVSHLGPLSAELTQLTTDLKTLDGKIPPGAKAALDAAEGATASADRTLAGVRGNEPAEASALIASPFVGGIIKVSTDLDALSAKLADAGMQAETMEINAHKQTLTSLQASLKTDLDKINLTGPAQKAEQDLKVVTPVIDTLFHDLNIISVSPVAVFDAARLWPDRLGTRYGPGIGVRLTIVTFNVTVGYAWNVNGSKTEGPGVLFFSLDISDVFR
jgi:hypothetical protein